MDSKDVNQHCGIPGQSGARVSLVAAACLMLGSIKAIRYLCDTSDSHRVSEMRFIAFNIFVASTRVRVLICSLH